MCRIQGYEAEFYREPHNSELRNNLFTNVVLYSASIKVPKDRVVKAGYQTICYAAAKGALRGHIFPHQIQALWILPVSFQKRNELWHVIFNNVTFWQV